MKITINNREYFLAVANTVRANMKEYEQETLLPAVKKIIFDDIKAKRESLKEYPIEGYYWETNRLKEYFQLIRNLQTNEDIYEKIQRRSSDEYYLIKNFLSNDLFGNRVTSESHSPLRRRDDIVTETMNNKEYFNLYEPHPWHSIDHVISKIIPDKITSPSLINLGCLINENECIITALETNSLYREIAYATGSYLLGGTEENEYIWNVSPAVEEMGSEVIEEYSDLIKKEILKPNASNIWMHKFQLNEPKIALVGEIILTKEFYHWVYLGGGRCFDFYDDGINTTEMLAQDYLKYEKIYKNGKN